jgi:iron complex outermembrane receptor protein
LLLSMSQAALAQEPADLFDLSIEELGRVLVVMPARQPQRVQRSASAIYVISAADIRRSGYRTLPEILRLAPGVEVARNGAHTWTISIRGFNDNLSNKLLVLIDGRSVYSPLFAGVFWDVQSTFIPDIERIEVVSGPGGALWGTNAVNGVINIITRAAGATQGLLVNAGAGNEWQGFGGMRYGWQPTDGMAARAYVKYEYHDSFEAVGGGSAFDEWHRAQAGFRVDWRLNETDELRIQGDVYDATLADLLRPDFTLGTLPGPDVPGDIDVAGHNLLGRWGRDLANGSLRLQAYLDYTERFIPGSFNERRDTADVDFEHQFQAGRHNLVWGGGYRWTSDDIDNTLFATFLPEERTDETLRLFAQDEMALLPEKLLLTLGLEVNDNDYTDWEWQPSLRLSWLIDEDRTLWAAVNRAVRIPARLNTDLVLTAPLSSPNVPVPIYFNVFGSDDYRSEELLAKEVGYRTLVNQDLWFDLALFHNSYDRLQTQEVGAPYLVGAPPEYLVIPGTLANLMEGDTWGGTLTATWQARPGWRLQFQYAYLDFDLNLKPPSANVDALLIAGNSPRQQAAVYSTLELPGKLELFAGLRYIDELPRFGLADRTAVDLSLGWRPLDSLRLALTARDLTDSTHLEFGSGAGSLIERSVYLQATWRGQ